jgi:lactate 2-monooxygenase
VVLGKEEQPKPTPQALRTLVQLTRAYPDKFVPSLRSGNARAAVQTFTRIYSRPSLTWENLPFLREHTKLPILLKGILHPDDARRAVDEGIDGIVVSNHGGRQVDGATSTIEALPGIAAAVDGRIPIVLDSGVRSGADAFKALALGATAVGLGRPYAYGLAIAGEAGVREVLQNFKADFDLTLGLAGCRTVADIGPESLASAAEHVSA